MAALFGEGIDNVLIEVNASERALVETYRGGRTFAFKVKFNFGKMQDDKMKMKRGRSRGSDGGMMEMY